MKEEVRHLSVALALLPVRHHSVQALSLNGEEGGLEDLRVLPQHQITEIIHTEGLLCPGRGKSDVHRVLTLKLQDRGRRFAVDQRSTDDQESWRVRTSLS